MRTVAGGALILFGLVGYGAIVTARLLSQAVGPDLTDVDKAVLASVAVCSTGFIVGGIAVIA